MVINIPGFTRLEECPRTIGCTAKVVWKDADGNLFRLDTNHGGDFVPHECLVRGSEKPSFAYLGEWYNKNTQRTRWVGPKRLERSVMKRPADKRAKPGDWQLVRTMVAKLEWEDSIIF